MDTIDKPIIPTDKAKELAAQLLAEKPKRQNKLDKLNESLAAKAYDNPDETHVKTLHPTKGYRKVSIKRLLMNGDIYHRMNIFWTTIAKAAKFKAESEEQNGKNQTTAS